MKILVCLKQILDPELSPRDFQVDSDRCIAARGSANLVTNIFCENALETALQLREAHGGEITALTCGDEEAEETLRKALALRVDHACRVIDPTQLTTRSAGAAYVLAAAIRQLGSFDLLMFGREAGDWGEGQTAGRVAEALGLACVSFVDRVELGDSGVRLHRQTDFGSEELEARLPIVLSITNNDENVPRIPKTRDIMLAHRKELQTLSFETLSLDSATATEVAASTEVVELQIPENTSSCEFVTGDKLDERVRAFAERIVKVVQSV